MLRCKTLSRNHGVQTAAGEMQLAQGVVQAHPSKPLAEVDASNAMKTATWRKTARKPAVPTQEATHVTSVARAVTSQESVPSRATREATVGASSVVRKAIWLASVRTPMLKEAQDGAVGLVVAAGHATSATKKVTWPETARRLAAMRTGAKEVRTSG